MNKKDLAKRDICSKYITLAVRDVVGWQEMVALPQVPTNVIAVKPKAKDAPTPKKPHKRYIAGKDKL